MDHFITGIIFYHPITCEVTRAVFSEHGIGLGTCLRIGDKDYPGIYIFQNPRLALRFLIETFIHEHHFAPVLISPYFDIESASRWFPTNQIILVTNTILPETLMHLRMLKPRVVPEGAVNVISYSRNELLLYWKRSRLLETHTRRSVALNHKSTLVSAGSQWFFKTTAELACSVDIRIHRVAVRKGRYCFMGEILSKSQRIPFRIYGKKRFAEKIEIKCLKHRIPFFCAPSLRGKLADISVAMSRVKRIKIYRVGIRHRQITLPNVIITPEKVRNTYMGLPEEPASKIRYYGNPRFSVKTLGEANQILLFSAICLAMAQRICFEKESKIAVICNNIADIEEFCKTLSIYRTDQEHKPWWPAFSDGFRIENIRDEGIVLYTVDIYRALLLAYYSRSILAFPTDQLQPFYKDSDLQSGLCLWLQECLRIKEERIPEEHKKSDQLRLFFERFSDLFNLEQNVRGYIVNNMKKSIKVGRNDVLFALIKQFLREGIISEKEVVGVPSTKFIVKRETLERALAKMGLEGLFWDLPDPIVVGPLDHCQRTPINPFMHLIQ